MLTRRAILAALFAAPAMKLLPGPTGPWRQAVSVAALERALRLAEAAIDTAAAVRAGLPTDRRATPEEMLAAHDAALRGQRRMYDLVSEPPGGAKA